MSLELPTANQTLAYPNRSGGSAGSSASENQFEVVTSQSSTQSSADTIAIEDNLLSMMERSADLRSSLGSESGSTLPVVETDSESEEEVTVTSTDETEVGTEPQEDTGLVWGVELSVDDTVTTGDTVNADLAEVEVKLNAVKGRITNTVNTLNQEILMNIDAIERLKQDGDLAETHAADLEELESINRQLIAHRQELLLKLEEVAEKERQLEEAKETAAQESTETEASPSADDTDNTTDMDTVDPEIDLAEIEQIDQEVDELVGEADNQVVEATDYYQEVKGTTSYLRETFLSLVMPLLFPTHSQESYRQQRDARIQELRRNSELTDRLLEIWMTNDSQERQQLVNLYYAAEFPYTV